MKVIQSAGSALFVPSEWLHTVANLEPCLSVNANWFNAHNLMCCYRRLRRSRAMKHARDQVTLARQTLQQRVSSVAKTSSTLHALTSSSDDGSQHDHCLERGSRNNSDMSDSSTPTPQMTLTPHVAEEKPSTGLSETEAPAGKAPFDIEDLVRLLTWKAREVSLQRTTSLDECSDDVDSMDYRAITEVAKAVTQEECFSESLRRKAAKILHVSQSTKEAGAG